VPLLRKAGVSEADLQAMTVHSPRRILEAGA
jgi:predicted metal-dependent phosphotriesterase family hydrolase